MNPVKFRTIDGEDVYLCLLVSKFSDDWISLFSCDVHRNVFEGNAILDINIDTGTIWRYDSLSPDETPGICLDREGKIVLSLS